ncbi:MAG: zinc dependent phospholipase C family protein [Clostridiales bacterium]|nr:zinc dependent phospholipase C family protein [Clostridiales bacterium]
MPAAYAHYVFGKKVFAELPRKEKQIIRRGRDAFLLGLHGPDLLFYFYPLKKNRVNQLGSRMHEEIAADFFNKGKENYQKKKDPVLRAYLYGFLCHYILDSECHPYVAYYMEERGLGHLAVETELDRYLMEVDGLDPLDYVPVHHLISRAHTRSQIASMFEDVTKEQIDISIRMFRRIITFLVCRSPLKRRLLTFICRVTGQKNHFGELIMDGRVHPSCEESDWFLEERLNHGVQIAVQEIENYSRVLESDAALSERLYQNYEGML